MPDKYNLEPTPIHMLRANMQTFSVPLAKEIGARESIILQIIFDYESHPDGDGVTYHKGMLFEEIKEKATFLSKESLRKLLHTLKLYGLIKVIRVHAFPRSSLLTYYYNGDQDDE